MIQKKIPTISDYKHYNRNFRNNHYTNLVQEIIGDGMVPISPSLVYSKRLETLNGLAQALNQDDGTSVQYWNDQMEFWNNYSGGTNFGVIAHPAKGTVLIPNAPFLREPSDWHYFVRENGTTCRREISRGLAEVEFEKYIDMGYPLFSKEDIEKKNRIEEEGQIGKNFNLEQIISSPVLRCMIPDDNLRSATVIYTIALEIFAMYNNMERFYNTDAIYNAPRKPMEVCLESIGEEPIMGHYGVFTTNPRLVSLGKMYIKHEFQNCDNLIGVSPDMKEVDMDSLTSLPDLNHLGHYIEVLFKNHNWSSAIDLKISQRDIFTLLTGSDKVRTSDGTHLYFDSGVNERSPEQETAFLNSLIDLQECVKRQGGRIIKYSISQS